MKSLIATNEWKLALFEKRHNYQTIILGTPPRAEVQYIKSALPDVYVLTLTLDYYTGFN